MNFVPRNQEHQRRQEDQLDWKTVAPRWLLLVTIATLCTLAGGLFALFLGSQSKDQQRLEAAIADQPTKYQARLSERVAVVEQDQALLRKSVEALTVEVKAQNAASVELTKQLWLLTTEMRRIRGEK
jgi:hypothetical protein